ncbi:MAG: sel1 repeat family protein [Nitrospira sp.]|nr:sel1 repeat family protein [Nitrospira sp.]MCP9461171.1 sel1 repeat family protein [Nitrospira sp.]MCP9475421.1 sel1 repeat family protein [Nitrospira sp.]
MSAALKFLMVTTSLIVLSGCVDSTKSPYVGVHDLVTRLNDARSLAEGGSADDQYRLGLRYERFARDYQEAARWYRMAAQQDHPDAMYRLCILSDRGLGLPQDYQEALRWCGLAADSRQANAMLVVGGFFERGRGVPKDVIQAYHWYNLAAAHGLEEGAKRRDRLAGAMTLRQITHAQDLTRNWKPKIEAPSE